ncbi:hypothetical protein [Streptomyces sp. WAC01280]|uniref:hypothetical protein n=1 Tax=Streptomyces sp. WAC01280 TaxID=2487424 RepID=UPI000F7AC12F|nr:hypothetical protein [Streptomyces sp. WAC01280]RSS59827.1 hypothetical protein EF909_08170 [Streptomyces sp. WAC01280]
MSTMRRPLGTGPTTSTRSTGTDPSPRLLPVERADGDVLLDLDEHQEHVAAKGRRLLGTGPPGS